MSSNPYDIEEAFATIEEELIESMIRNMKRHKAEEDDEGFHWEMWQAKQLESLKRYKDKNKKVFPKRFAYINERMEELIKEANKDGYMEQEKTILGAIKNGFKGYNKASNTMQAEFFKLNERKLEALIKATTNDMRKAETAILRMAEDKYRQVIFNAQVYANTGAGTYEKAVDMATKDMLTAGLNCVEYANGSRHRLKDYADMAIRTASKRAYLQGEGTKRQEWGISTVIVNKRGNPCPKCLPFCGKVLIDDVWSGGKASDGPYPLVSDAIEAGLYHPRCKDSHTTYFEGLDDDSDDTYTEEEIKDIEQDNLAEQKQQYAKRQAEKFGRLEKYSLDAENKKKYHVKRILWSKISHVIDTLQEHEPLLLSNLPKEYKSEIFNMISKSEYKIQKILLKYANDINFINVNAMGRGVTKRKGIRLNWKNDSKNIRGSYTTTFHEMGHSIDRAGGGLSYKDSRFKDALINDFTSVVKEMERVYNLNQEEVYEIISLSLETDKYHAASDIVGGITRNKCVGRYGHETNYWKQKYSLEKEAFAHFFEAYARNDDEKINILRQMFPTATDEFIKILEAI